MIPKQPSWATPSATQHKKQSGWKAVGIGCGGFLGAMIVLSAVGTLTSSHGNGSSVATRSVAPKPASHPVVQPSTVRPTTAISTAKPAPDVDLAFLGGYNGSAKQADNVLPIKTGAHYDYHVPEGSTQCVMPAPNGAWTANVVFHTGTISWEITIGEPGFGLPKAGAHPALPQNLTGGSMDDSNAVSIWIGSDKSPDGFVSGSGVGRFGIGYYTPRDHNNGAGIVTIDPSLTSGTIDAWLTPSQPDLSLVFHLTGRWSCTP